MSKFSKYSDEKLVSLLKKDKQTAEKAFQEIYNRYSSLVHAYCFRVFNDSEQAEDVFQETFLKFYEKVDVNNKLTNVPGFLITIARNLCLNIKRDKQAMVSIDNIQFPVDNQINYENRELLDLIKYAMELLDFEYREAFVLREYDGLPYTEIAEITGTTLTNAKSRVFRAKQKIKDILQPYLQEFI